MSALQTVLLADDDITVRTLARAALEQGGYRVIEAETGIDALNLAKQDPPDLVMLDVIMPGIDGYEVCRALRLQYPPSLPIVMVTGRDDLSALELAFSSGATDFLSKPLNWRVIGHRVRYLLRARDALIAAERVGQQLKQAQRIARLGHWVYDWTQHKLDISGDLREMIHFNALTGASTEHLAQLIHPEDGPTMQSLFVPQASNAPPESEFRMRAPEGYRWFRMVVEHQTNEQGQRLRSVGVVQDIAERKAHELEIQKLAYFDALTGLSNRRGFMARLEHELAQAEASNQALCLLFVDLDNFKTINDALGHDAGDEVLTETANRFKAVLRASDAIGLTSQDHRRDLARLGGDEFTLLLSGLRDPADAERVADRMVKALRQPFLVAGKTVSVTASIGIACYPRDAKDLSGLLKHADSAMYIAKESGRDAVRNYEASYGQRMHRELLIANALREALDRNQLSVVYQPLMDARYRVAGLEALVRWKHPELGVVSPGEFIPVAERHGLVPSIGEWVLIRAMSELAPLHAEFPHLSLSVNVSPGQLKVARLEMLVPELLSRFKLPARVLALEVTESVLIDAAESVVDRLKTIQALGVGLVLDDFGTGYASMSYLKRLPLTGIKIDGMFVREITRSAGDLAIVRAMIAVAQEFGLGTTVECVETKPQADLLLTLGVHLQQGFLYSPGVPLADLSHLLRRGWTPTQDPT